MIILDTNVLSETMKHQSSSAVEAWLDRQALETFYLTATSLAELLAGIAVIPAGKRRDALSAAVKSLVERLFGSRVLPFDGRAAIAYATAIQRTRAKGYSISMADAQIAAIAAVSNFSVATRDTAPFVAAGIHVINPWIA